MKESALKTKSKAFALRIIKMYNYLCEQKKEYVMSKQVLRSGTSIGANVAEAFFAQRRLRHCPMGAFLSCDGQKGRAECSRDTNNRW